MNKDNFKKAKEIEIDISEIDAILKLIDKLIPNNQDFSRTIITNSHSPAYIEIPIELLKIIKDMLISHFESQKIRLEEQFKNL